MKLNDKDIEPFARMAANLLLWVAFAAVVALGPVLTDATASSVRPAQAILKYVDKTFFWYQVAAAAIVLTMFIVLKWLSTDEAEAKRAWSYALLGVEEWGGVLINFGSLSLIAGFVASQFSLWPGAIGCYAVGYLLIRKP